MARYTVPRDLDGQRIASRLIQNIIEREGKLRGGLFAKASVDPGDHNPQQGRNDQQGQPGKPNEPR